jgi:hypothetical protein
MFALAMTCQCGLIDLGDLRGDAGDAATTADASDAALVIRCGSPDLTCDPASSDCCNQCDGGGSTCATVCVPSVSACAGSDDALFQCSDPGSCKPNEVCCALLGGPPDAAYYWKKSLCMSSADACAAYPPSRLMCNPDVPTCPQGTACLSEDLANTIGMATCQ